MPSAAAVPAGRPAASALRIWLTPALVGLGVYVICVVHAQSLLNDGDTLMHIVIGRWIIAHRALPFHDPFSYTAHGRLWVPHEWLSDVVFAALYDHLGWGGVVAVTVLASAVAFALLTRALEKTLVPRRAAIGAVLAFLLTQQHLLARPHALALPAMVVWMAAIIRARDRNRVPSLWLLPLVVLWCNLHGGVVVGVAMAGLLAIEAAIEAPPPLRFSVIKKWLGFTGLAAASALLSPNGIHVYLLVFDLVRMRFAMSHISEWRGADFTAFQPLEIWIALASLGGLTLGLRLPRWRIAIVLVLLYEALTHVRNAELLGIIGTLLVAAPVAKQLGSAEPQPPERAALPGGGAVLRAAIGVTAGMAFALVATALALNRRDLHPPAAAAPVAAVQAAFRAGVSGHVLNAYRFGGYLMFEHVPVFIDGRADLYGDAFIKRFALAMDGVGDGVPALLSQYGITWAILAPQAPAAAVFAQLPDWRRLYAGRDAVVFRRTGPPKGRMRREQPSAPPGALRRGSAEREGGE